MGMVLMVLVVFMMDIEAIIMAKSRMGFRGRRTKSLGHMNVMLRRRHPPPIFKYNWAGSVASLLQFFTSS